LVAAVGFQEARLGRRLGAFATVVKPRLLPRARTDDRIAAFSGLELRSWTKERSILMAFTGNCFR
jgi:hypothetical protein